MRACGCKLSKSSKNKEAVLWREKKGHSTEREKRRKHKVSR